MASFRPVGQRSAGGFCYHPLKGIWQPQNRKKELGGTILECWWLWDVRYKHQVGRLNKFFTSCKPGITSEGKSQSLPLRQLEIVWDSEHISDSCSQTEHDLGPKCSFFGAKVGGFSTRLWYSDTLFSAVFGSPGIGPLLPHRSEFSGPPFPWCDSVRGMSRSSPSKRRNKKRWKNRTQAQQHLCEN